jgi:hypothetical protein
MTTLNVKRVTGLPETVDPSTLYIVKGAQAGVVELYFTSQDGAEIRRIPTISDIATLISQGTAFQAKTLETPRKINGVDFDGSQDITLPGPDLSSFIHPFILMGA